MENRVQYYVPDEIYKPLHPDALPHNTLDLGEGGRAHQWKTYLTDSVPLSSLVKEQFENEGKYEKTTRLKKKKIRRKSRAQVNSEFDLSVSKCRRRGPKLTRPSEGVRFKTFVSLREMWTAYIGNLLHVNTLSKSNYMDAAIKLSKADLHGCPLVVHKSKCPGYVGVSGIVIQESRNVFVLITPTDQVKRIPKRNSVFSVVLGKYVFSLHGNQLLVQPGNRASKKFKVKATIDL